MSSQTKSIGASGGVVTFLDVLGWRGVYERMPNAVASLTNLVERLRTRAESQRGKVQGDISVRSISDTIAVFTKCDYDEAPKTMRIHGELAQFLLPLSVEAEIPVRGAISYGEFEIQDNIFVGKAVDEAAAWHEFADWIGVHLTPSAEYVLGQDSSDSLWVRYTPPCKVPLAWIPHCVNWTASWTDRTQETKSIKAKFRRLGPIVPDIAVKFANTLAFIEAVNPDKGS
jgi:hypothetical protein